MPNTSDLPSDAELQRLQDIGLAHLRSCCINIERFIVHETTDTTLPVKLALASLGSCQSATFHRSQVWSCTDQLLKMVIGTDNRYVRQHISFVTWLINEVAALMAGDPKIWSSANVSHYMGETAIRRTWASMQLQPVQWSDVSHIADMIPYVLQVDLVRALTLQCTPTAASSFCRVVLRWSTKTTIASLTLAMFEPESSSWVFDDSHLGFLKLLILLHETTMTSVVLLSIPLSKTETSTPVTSLSFNDEISFDQERLRSALSCWYDCYFESANNEVRAMYHFCRLYQLIPQLLTLPQQARCRDKIEIRGTNESETYPNPSRSTSHTSYDSVRQSLKELETPNDSQSSCNASQHAWLLYRYVRRASSENADTPSQAIYLPIITYLAALHVWKEIESTRDEAKMYNGISALKLFKSELQKLPWVGSHEMARNLEYLSSEFSQFR